MFSCPFCPSKDDDIKKLVKHVIDEHDEKIKSGQELEFRRSENGKAIQETERKEQNQN